MKVRLAFRKTAWISAIVALAGAQAFAWPPTYGREYNVSNRKVTKAWRARKSSAPDSMEVQKPGKPEQDAAARVAAEIKNLCGSGCKVVPYENFRPRSTDRKANLNWTTEFSVQFTSGLTYNVSIDPGVVEVQSMPRTPGQYQESRSVLKNIIYPAFKNAELSTKGETAHFNIGMNSAFESDPEGLLGFYLVFANRPELMAGILSDEDPSEAKPVRNMGIHRQGALEDIARDARRGRFRNARELALRIREEVEKGQKTGAVSLWHISEKSDKDEQIELRGIRQPSGVEEDALQTELIDALVQRARAGKLPLVFRSGERVSYTPAELATRFYVFLAENDLDWNHFKPLLSAKVATAGVDPLVYGRVDWSDPEQLGILSRMAEDIRFSPWMRNKLLEILSTPEAAKSRRSTTLLRGLVEKARDDRELKAQLDPLLEDLRKAPAWQKKLGRLDALKVSGEKGCLMDGFLDGFE